MYTRFKKLHKYGFRRRNEISVQKKKKKKKLVNSCSSPNGLLSKPYPLKYSLNKFKIKIKTKWRNWSGRSRSRAKIVRDSMNKISLAKGIMEYKCKILFTVMELKGLIEGFPNENAASRAAAPGVKWRE